MRVSTPRGWPVSSPTRWSNALCGARRIGFRKTGAKGGPRADLHQLELLLALLDDHRALLLEVLLGLRRNGRLPFRPARLLLCQLQEQSG